MFKNYIKIAFRNLLKNKSHTLINVGGLTLGVICSVVIFLVIQYDLSFDTHHIDGDRVYRVVNEDTQYGRLSYDRGGPYPLAKAIEEEITGIEAVTIIDNNFSNPPIVTVFDDANNPKRFKLNDFGFVEPDFFNIFTIKWISGDSADPLSRPNTAIISESYAKKLFGETDVIGKNLVFDIGSKADLEITGVIQDSPKTTDFHFDILASSESKNRAGQTADKDNWNSFSSSLQTYVKLAPGVTPEQINKQFDSIVSKYRGEERVATLDFFLQPLHEIHFDSRFGNYTGRTVEKTTLFTLGIIGFFLLITACINFINLNTAIAVSRSKEVGLRKTLGGTRTQLTIHFLSETAFITFISILFGVGLSEFVLHLLEPIIDFAPSLEIFTNPQALIFLMVLFFVVTLVAGWYPAQHLSSFSPIQAIRNKINSSYGRGLTLRRSLIVAQFTITQILIICTVVIVSQINFFQNHDLGYDKEAIIEINIPNQDNGVLSTFKNKLLAESSIQNVTFSNTGATSNNVWGGNYIIFKDTTRIENNAHIKFVDEDYVDTYGLTILAGENLTPSDTINKFLVNESFAKQIGYGESYDELIGKINSFWGNDAPIVGVVKDFNSQSPQNEISPVILAVQNRYYTGAVKINSSNTQEAVQALERAFVSAFPEFIFEYTFLDEDIANMFEDERNTARIMNAFTLIAIIIGGLGLFGLVSYMATTRTKEIAVRKVLGATVNNILGLFGKELGILTGVSFVIASPIAWYLMQQWLAEYPYRIEMGIEIFAITLGGTLLLASLTVGFKSLKAAFSNPVNSLKNE